MRKHIISSSLLIALMLTLMAASAQVTFAASTSVHPQLRIAHHHQGSSVNLHSMNYRQVCKNDARAGYVHCMSFIAQPGTNPQSGGGGPVGYGPPDLQDAYVLPSQIAGGTQTVAIVDAFDDPNAEADLAVYRSNYSLSPCSSSNGCFRKVDQNGGTSYPPANAGWAVEISLDVDMVSAICPNCNILLVEANDNNLGNLGTAVNTAARLGANAISNSYGGGEWSGETSAESAYYNHPGVAITASSGDGGYGVSFPAASQYVTAVGGTTLSVVDGYWIENAWSGAGSGCSAYITKPSWQTDPGCSRRTVADVSAVATFVAVYDTYSEPGWVTVAGTSISSPISASVYALAGNTSSINYGSYPYYHTDSLFDITSGSNGSCGGSYLCTAGVGYDGPTGLGTPDGSDAF